MWLLQKRRHDIVSQRAFNRWRHTRYSGTAADGTTNWLGWAEGRFVAWISALTADVAVAVVNRRSTSTIQPDHTFSFTANYVWSHARWSPPRQQACRYAFVCLHISLQASASARCILLSVLANRFLSLVLCDRYQTAYITCTPLLVSDWQQTAFTESDEHFLRFVAFIVFLCRFFFFLPFFSFFIVFCFIRTLSKR